MAMTQRDIFSFGSLLKTFRTRRHLTQQHLATALGMHRHAIGRWEQGDVLPASKAMIFELATHLRLDEQETRHLLEASLTGLSPHWLVPFPRNPFFTGRAAILEALHAQLGVKQAVALTQSAALHGLGGVGKTQVALEYAYRYALEYSAVFWIRTETIESIFSSLLHIAEVLQLPERNDRDEERVVGAVQRWLATRDQWLLIWDNVEDLALLDRFLPATRSGAILVTTRSQTLGTYAWGMDLLPMEHEEGINFLLRRAKMLVFGATLEQTHQLAEQMPLQYKNAVELVTALGGLPLALDQAGAYIEETGCGLSDYLQRYAEQHVYLLDRRGTSGQYHPLSVTTTFRLSRERIEQEHQAAANVLHVCALLHAEAIPEELFLAGASYLGPELASLATNLSQFDQALGTLRNLSLIQRQPATHTVSLHRLVQAVLREQMDEQAQNIWLTRVTAALNAVFPEVSQETWESCERLLPHVLACEATIQEQEEDQTLAEVLQKAANYLRARAQFKQAEPLYIRVMHIRERTWGQQHLLVASACHNLANLYYDQGKYEQAEALYLRVLHVREQILGPEHLEVTIPLGGLGRLYWSQGKYKQAELLLLKSLHIRERILEPQNPLIGTGLNNLAILYMEQGKPEQAEPLFERALQAWEQAYGPEDSHVAASFNNLAILAAEQGKYERAELLYQNALSIQEKTLGVEHPEIAHPLNGLADIYTEQGKYEQAEPLYQQALTVREKALGTTHPLVAQILHGLANLYAQQGQCAQAEPLYQRVLRIREEYLGQQHPDTAQTLHDLAVFQQKQGRLSEAISFCERALSIRSLSLEEAHPKTIATRALLAQLLQEQTCMQETAGADQDQVELPVPYNSGLRPQDTSSSENSALQAFLKACCELHPRAWCRISDLWQAYEQWTREQQERFPLSRRAFTTQLKAHGCHVSRTATARIWYGISILPESASYKVTENDRK